MRLERALLLAVAVALAVFVSGIALSAAREDPSLAALVFPAAWVLCAGIGFFWAFRARGRMVGMLAVTLVALAGGIALFSASKDPMLIIFAVQIVVLAWLGYGAIAAARGLGLVPS